MRPAPPDRPFKFGRGQHVLIKPMHGPGMAGIVIEQTARYFGEHTYLVERFGTRGVPIRRNYGEAALEAIDIQEKSQ